MKLGILVEVEERLDWDRWRATYTAAERLGLESVWLSDHLQSPWSPGTHGLETWTALAVAAAETQRIVLGSLVSPITFRAPGIVARMAESLATLSNGRFVVGLGLGWNADEHAAIGIDFPPAHERGRRLNEGIERIRRELGPRKVPVLVGGKGARYTLPIVARYADAWNLTTSSPAEFARASADLDALCRDFGREPRAILRSVAAGALIGRDASDLAARAERMRACVPPLANAEDVQAAAREMGWLVGTSGDVMSVLDELVEAGVERVIFGHYDLDAVDTLEVIADAFMGQRA